MRSSTRLRVDRRLFALGLILSLAGCVAPEVPPPARAAAPVPTVQAPSNETFEDAPRPNRAVRGPSSSIIQMGK